MNDKQEITKLRLTDLYKLQDFDWTYEAIQSLINSIILDRFEEIRDKHFRDIRISTKEFYLIDYAWRLK